MSYINCWEAVSNCLPLGVYMSLGITCQSHNSNQPLFGSRLRSCKDFLSHTWSEAEGICFSPLFVLYFTSLVKWSSPKNIRLFHQFHTPSLCTDFTWNIWAYLICLWHIFVLPWFSCNTCDMFWYRNALDVLYVYINLFCLSFPFIQC